MAGFEGIGDFEGDPWERYIAHQAAKGNYGPWATPNDPRITVEPLLEEGAPRCPNCHRVMSNREKDEQGCCNDCYDGTITWT